MCSGSCDNCLMGVLGSCLATRDEEEFFELTETSAIRILNDKDIEVSGTGLNRLFNKYPKLKFEYGSKKVC